ncbi:hypothetical protein [Oceaniglobus roseus]|uniref:hypothetical protein n=1 Tax=Oceaniglobus roseus TaxID=1737570 RepID=UPI000C7EF25B|nr:hypothetical protein [Kandeliimicrobium roseum]
MTYTAHAPHAHAHAHADAPRLGVLGWIRTLGQSFGTAVMLSQQMRARQALIQTLHGKDDAELKALGISRDGINAHVYPELFGK